MITIITGKPGAGKTLFMTYKALEMFLAGFDVYANFNLDFSEYIKAKKADTKKVGAVYYWSEVPELFPIKGGHIFVDEAQEYFDSRDWKDMAPSVRHKFATHRHDIRQTQEGKIIPLEIWAGVQHVSNIDKRIRDISQEFVEMKNVRKKIFMCSYYELKYLRDESVKRVALKRRFFLMNKLKANCFHTHAQIGKDYEEFDYKREYECAFSNKNNGLVPKRPGIPPFSERKKKY